MVRVALVSLLFAAACHHATPAPTTPVAQAPAPRPATPPPAQQASPNVYVSDDLAKQCTLHVDNVQEAPKFDYDAASLEPADRDVLEKIATCVTNGPLHGRHLELVGRADPRGTEEYNMGLGSRRAGTVREFLQRLGVMQGQLAQTTRGALDANGTDDSTWKLDRRVDITLQ
jgi:peptidoglycan-associated lipoprotein